MPSITSQPTDQVIKVGQSATFAVGATGTAPLAYQWQKNGTNVSGATAASYTTGTAKTADSGSKFDVMVSDTAGSVTSSMVTLTVNPATLVSIAVTPANPSITEGATQQFTAIGTFSDSTTQGLSNAVWASGTATVATISNTGLATTVGTGTSTISATSGSITGSTVLKVTPAPSIAGLNPNSGAVGTSVTITGTNFGTTQGTSTVTFSGMAATPTSWNASSIVAPVPAGAATGNVVVTVGGQASNGAGFTVTAYPLKVSKNGRYLVDQNNVPFMILGDSPQSMMANLSTSDLTDMKTYMADRQAHGFNSILVMALCDTYTAVNSSGTSYEGFAPFTIGSSPSNYDLSTPNPAYFSRLDSLISTAASYGLVVFLDPIETGGWVTTLEYNGTANAYTYGKFLGNRYKNSPNIVWNSGNDFQTWKVNSTDNNLVYQVMAGIASADPNHVQTIELDYFVSYSSQDTALTLSSVLTLDSAYTYYETYDEVLTAYNSLPTLPTFLTEENYEYENNTHSFSGLTGAFVLREQEYWTMTSGACGQLYGNHYTWTFTSGWQSFLDSPGTLELAYLTKLFNSIPWWNLVPDQTHQVVTSGYGTYNGKNGNLPNADYVTTAWITDGSLAIVYDPAGKTLTVNLAKFNQPVTAAWYDPSNGMFTLIPGSPFPNSGTPQFMPPGTNHDGNSDWVLVFEVNPVFP